jgi:aspartyl-tRNA(Asn)/glutamyl-tRNA(Gln) amidotransferase subunit A
MSQEFDTLSRVREALQGGAASALDIVERTLEKIAHADGELGAFVALDAERAKIDARYVDALRAGGAPLGPLAGAPIGIKDLIDVAGLPTRAGSLTRADATAAATDAPIVSRLRAAGAIIIGKTHTVEYAFGGWGTNEAVGTPLNPRDRDHPRAPGGSSSGSAVAVAGGLVPVAIGSDTGGSVRLPASFSGCVGLKTTVGLIDASRVLPLAPAFDSVGPLTSNVADAAIVLSVLAPPQDDRSSGWSGRLADLAKGEIAVMDGRRIAVVANTGIALHSETARVFSETQARLQRLGASVEEIMLPESLAELSAPLGEILALEAYRLYGRFAEAEPSVMDAAVRGRILGGREIRAHRLSEINEHRQVVKRAFAMIFDRFDAILTPATALPAPLISEHDEAASPALFTRFVNYLDLAALSLPMGVTPIGLPIGLQIVVPGLAEPLALEIGGALEADRGELPLA